MSSTIGSLSSSTWVNSLFSKIDTKNQGFIDKTELQSALEQISSDSTSSVDKIFSKLDADSDGKITKQEMSDGMQKLAEELDSQFNAARIKGTYESTSTDDAGFTKEELASQVEEIGDTDSKRTTLMTSIINNFDKADTDGNGKVSRLEAMAYDEENQISAAASNSGTTTVSGKEMPPPPPPSSASSTGSDSNSTSYAAADTNQDGKVSIDELIAYQSSNETTTSNDSSSVMKMMVQLMRAYGVLEQESAQSAASTSISAIA